MIRSFILNLERKLVEVILDFEILNIDPLMFILFWKLIPTDLES